MDNTKKLQEDIYHYSINDFIEKIESKGNEE